MAFLPLTVKEMKSYGWEQPDFIYIIGDAYVDHPSFGPAIISRVLENFGYKVCIISQPDINDEKVLADFAVKVKEQLIANEDLYDRLQLPGNRPYKQLPPVFPSKPKLTDACIKCGICVNACPVQAIPADLSESMDEATCISCMRCEAVCPVKARKLAQPVIDFLTEKLNAGAQGYKENQLFL